MKYNFVYDTDFIEKNSICLSEEEKNIVFATVVGEHNAIFYGYKPERLVKAIKVLTSQYPFIEAQESNSISNKLHEANGGILYTQDLDSWLISNQQYLYQFSKNDWARGSQFIATTSECPFETVTPDVINNFDIIYKCKEDDKKPFLKAQIVTDYKEVDGYHHSLHSGHFITSTELTLSSYWIDGPAYDYLYGLKKENPVIARKVYTVSRSVSDYKHHSLTIMSDVRIAEFLCGVRKDVDLSDFEQELF